MSGQELVNLVVNSGGMAGLAIFAIWMVNRMWELRLEEMQRHARDIRELRDVTYQALQKNVEVMQQLVERLEQLDR